MTDQHRATPEQWAKCEEDARLWSGALNCILELRDRIEALEADQLEQAESHRFCTDAIVRRVEALEAAYEETAMAELRAANAEAQPGSLVERVANAIYNVPHDSAAEARAAIREVAKWLRVLPGWEESTMNAIANIIEQEADRG
jgi:hypothetical protein